MKNWKQLALLTGAVVMAGCGQKKAKEHEKPNFLLIISDDQSWVHNSSYGNQVVQTPEFDKLAEKGFLFRNAFCASPHCSASRANILTGMNQWQLKEAGTHASNFPSEFLALPEILMEHGYAIGCTGKAWSPGKWDITGRERNPAGDQYNKYKMENLPAKFLTSSDPVRNLDDFLSQKEPDQPFWFWYGSIEPHVQYEKRIGLKNGIDTAGIQLPAFVPNHPDAKIEMSDYYFEIEWFDKQVGWLVELLKEKGLAKNTVIVVTSDNGIVLPRCKRNLYEYGSHMPLAIYWPKMKNKGEKIDRLTSFIDFAPTFLELAGIEIPDQMTGKSFARLFTKDGISTENDPAHVLTGFERHDHRRYDNLGYPMRAIRTDRYLFIKNYKPDRWPEGDPEVNRYGQGTNITESSWTSNYTYFEPGSELFELAFGKRPARELYDIIQDPECINNLAETKQYRSVADSLHRVLRNRLVEQGDPRELGYGDIFESYPRHGSMKEYIGGFKERGEYNPKYHVHPGH